ncbi:hypothetical protein VTH06DRAFT_7279 [Thermothelomyces fergusii]
MAAYKLQ